MMHCNLLPFKFTGSFGCKLTIAGTKNCKLFSVLTHVDSHTNTPKMVDISGKSHSLRVAHARATVSLPKEVFSLLQQTVPNSKCDIISAKGPVFATAIVAGVLAAKKTADLIPFCHPVALDDCAIDIALCNDDHAAPLVIINCTTKTTHKTGVEVEALVGATNAALCVYDMLKAVSHDIRIVDVKLMEKTGGKSHFKRLD